MATLLVCLSSREKALQLGAKPPILSYRGCRIIECYIEEVGL